MSAKAFRTMSHKFDCLSLILKELSDNFLIDVEQDDVDEENLYKSMWKEINNCMADNYFMNIEDKSEDVWKTPRESWHTTCDGYIDTKDINDALKKVDGYSKILKTRKQYDKIVTENGASRDKANDLSPISFNSQVVVSYSNNKVKF